MQPNESVESMGRVWSESSLGASCRIGALARSGSPGPLALALALARWPAASCTLRTRDRAGPQALTFPMAHLLNCLCSQSMHLARPCRQYLERERHR